MSFDGYNSVQAARLRDLSEERLIGVESEYVHGLRIYDVEVSLEARHYELRRYIGNGTLQQTGVDIHSRFSLNYIGHDNDDAFTLRNGSGIHVTSDAGVVAASPVLWHDLDRHNWPFLLSDRHDETEMTDKVTGARIMNLLSRAIVVGGNEQPDAVQISEVLSAAVATSEALLWNEYVVPPANQDMARSITGGIAQLSKQGEMFGSTQHVYLTNKEKVGVFHDTCDDDGFGQGVERVVYTQPNNGESYGFSALYLMRDGEIIFSNNQLPAGPRAANLLNQIPSGTIVRSATAQEVRAAIDVLSKPVEGYPIPAELQSQID